MCSCKGCKEPYSKKKYLLGISILESKDIINLETNMRNELNVTNPRCTRRDCLDAPCKGTKTIQIIPHQWFFIELIYTALATSDNYVLPEVYDACLF